MKTIMIVDDDLDMRLGLDIRLRASGYDTVFAADAISAVATARKRKPDLIILDLGLPGGDGFVVMDRLHLNPDLASIPVIVITAREPMGNREESLKRGASAFFQKPVDNSDMLAAIEKLLGKTVHG